MNLEQLFTHFPDEDSCLTMLEGARWGDRPECPYCGVRSSCPVPKERRHHCNVCGTTFSVTAQTLFHKTKVDLRRWFLAIWILTDPQRQESIRGLAAEIGVNKNTAAFMAARIRLAQLQQSPLVHAVIRHLVHNKEG